jgi:hypothetical protein
VRPACADLVGPALPTKIDLVPPFEFGRGWQQKLPIVLAASAGRQCHDCCRVATRFGSSGLDQGRTTWMGRSRDLTSRPSGRKPNPRLSQAAIAHARRG